MTRVLNTITTGNVNDVSELEASATVTVSSDDRITREKIEKWIAANRANQPAWLIVELKQ